MNVNYNELSNKYINGNSEFEICSIPVFPNLEICKLMALYESKLGYCPTVMFNNVVDSEYNVLVNPFKKKQIIKSFGIENSNWLSEIYKNYNKNKNQITFKENKFKKVESITCLPIMKHQPMDCGSYITSGITITKNLDNDSYNLGIYRIKMIDNEISTIFMNKASDGFKNFEKYIQRGLSMPITVTIGAEMYYYLIAAAKLPYGTNDFKEVSKIINENIELYNFDTNPSPDGQFILTGHVINKKMTEGIFGEFKGYYVENEYAYQIKWDKIYCNENPLYIGLSAGKESGLTLSAMQGEWLLYKNLTDLGYKIKNITYRIEEAGEFVAVIETDSPSSELIEKAFGYDSRLKFVFCGRKFSDNPWKDVSIFPFKSIILPYTGSSKFSNNGERIGFLMLFDGNYLKVAL